MEEIVLNDPEISSLLKEYDNDYIIQIEEANLSNTGYLHLNDSFYRVRLDTGKSGPLPYMIHYDLLIAVNLSKIMESEKWFDVMGSPNEVYLPSHTVWYAALRVVPYEVYPPQKAPFLAYLGVEPYPGPTSLEYFILNSSNFGNLSKDLPYSALNFSELGADHVGLNSTATITSPALPGVAISQGSSIPIPMIITTQNWSYVKLSYTNMSETFYLVVKNVGSQNTTVKVATWTTSS